MPLCSKFNICITQRAKGGKFMETTNKKTNNADAFAKLLANVVVSENSTKRGETGIYKPECFADCETDRDKKSARKKIRNRCEDNVLDGIKTAKNLGKEAFSDWVKRVWKPFAESTYKNPQIFFEEKGNISEKTLQRNKLFAELLKTIK